MPVRPSKAAAGAAAGRRAEMNQAEESMYGRASSRRVPGGRKGRDRSGEAGLDDRSGGHDGPFAKLGFPVQTWQA